jgi:hypothetical protein
MPSLFALLKDKAGQVRERAISALSTVLIGARLPAEKEAEITEIEVTAE